jgi:hypothetical protein
MCHRKLMQENSQRIHCSRSEAAGRQAALYAAARGSFPRIDSPGAGENSARHRSFLCLPVMC